MTRPGRRWAMRAATFLAGVLGGGLVLGCCAFSAPRYEGPPSDHFDGRRFHNAVPSERGFGDLLRWMATRKPAPWSEFTEQPPGAPPPRRVGPGEMRVTFINHATTLVQMDGLNILTDPVWSERVGPTDWSGPHRRRAPGILFADLPPIDVVLVSHNHYDHLDLPTIERLQKEFHPRIFAGLGNHALFEREGVARSTDLDWWQEAKLSDGVTLTSVPAQHFSMRGLCDRDATLWTGFVVRGPSGAVFFAGDTGYGPHFAEIRRRIGPIRLALLPIGAYLPRWVMAPVHMSPDEAVQAQLDLGADVGVGIHFGTFQQTDEAEDQPPIDVRAAVLRIPDPKPRFWVLGFGEGRDVPGPSAARN